MVPVNLLSKPQSRRNVPAVNVAFQTGSKLKSSIVSSVRALHPNKTSGFTRSRHWSKTFATLSENGLRCICSFKLLNQKPSFKKAFSRLQQASLRVVFYFSFKRKMGIGQIHTDHQITRI